MINIVNHAWDNAKKKKEDFLKNITNCFFVRIHFFQVLFSLNKTFNTHTEIEPSEGPVT